MFDQTARTPSQELARSRERSWTQRPINPYAPNEVRYSQSEPYRPPGYPQIYVLEPHSAHTAYVVGYVSNYPVVHLDNTVQHGTHTAVYHHGSSGTSQGVSSWADQLSPMVVNGSGVPMEIENPTPHDTRMAIHSHGSSGASQSANHPAEPISPMATNGSGIPLEIYQPLNHDARTAAYNHVSSGSSDQTSNFSTGQILPVAANGSGVSMNSQQSLQPVHSFQANYGLVYAASIGHQVTLQTAGPSQSINTFAQQMPMILSGRPRTIWVYHYDNRFDQLRAELSDGLGHTDWATMFPRPSGANNYNLRRRLHQDGNTVTRQTSINISSKSHLDTSAQYIKDDTRLPMSSHAEFEKCVDRERQGHGNHSQESNPTYKSTSCHNGFQQKGQHNELFRAYLRRTEQDSTTAFQPVRAYHQAPARPTGVYHQAPTHPTGVYHQLPAHQSGLYHQSPVHQQTRASHHPPIQPMRAFQEPPVQPTTASPQQPLVQSNVRGLAMSGIVNGRWKKKVEARALLRHQEEMYHVAEVERRMRFEASMNNAHNHFTTMR